MKPAGTHEPDKTHKPDPVSAAMAMMRQVVPVALPPSVAHAGAAKQPDAPPQPVEAAPAAATHVAAQAREQTALQAGALARAVGEDAHAPQNATEQPANPAPSGASALNNVAALTAGQLAGTHAVAHAPSAAVSAMLSEPVGSSGWTAQLGTQLTWMARQGVQSASLQVSPQHLGPVQVSISVHHGQASVWFGAAQPQTRQALTQALPELRAMFANQGLALTDSGVSHEAPRDPRRPARPAVGAIGEVGAPEAGTGATGGALAGVGLIDTYA